MRDDARRVAVTACEAAAAALVTLYVMNPAKLANLRTLALWRLLAVSRRVAVASGGLSLRLEAAYHRSVDH